MIEIVCAAIASISTIVCAIIAMDGRKRGKLEDDRAQQRSKEARLQLQMMDANTKLTIGVAMALKNGHANGEVEDGLKAVKAANEEYVKFLEGIALDDIRK